MNSKKISGQYLNSFLGNSNYEENLKEVESIEKKINIKDNEAAYVYSFKKNKLLFIHGFDKFLGLEHSELNIKKLHSIWNSDGMEFFKEFHDRVFLYLYNNNFDIESFICHTIVCIDKTNRPVNHSVRVFETDDNGNLESVLVKLEFNDELKVGNIIQYTISGAKHEYFFKEIKYNLNFPNRISKREIEIIESFEDEGKSKKIFSKVSLKPEEFVVVIEKLISRFGLNTRTELIQFAKDNYLIPCQFKG